MRKNILVITHDPVGEKMAGIGMRNWELSRSLSKFFNVTLATPYPYNSTLKSDPFQVVSFDWSRLNHLRNIVKKNDVVIAHGIAADLLSDMPKDNKRSFVIDLVCPYHLENLEFGEIQYKGSLEQCNIGYFQALEPIRNQIEAGDFFICASERQKDYWLGLLTGENRLNSYIYKSDKSFKNLIDVVPFGIPANKPVHRKQMIKGVWKDISKKDFVVLWGGGIWNWFDPLTLIKAMAIVRKKQKNIKLVFICSKHPNERNPAHNMTKRAYDLSKSLGLYNKNVFFYSDWVPYKERENYLLESDIGVVSHFDNIENRFSFRTRVMDYLWAGLPIISTKGDCMSDLIERYQLGLVVDYKDVKGWADSILLLYKNKRLRSYISKNVKRVAKEFTWDNVTKPLVEFCKNATKRKETNRKRIDKHPSPKNYVNIPTPMIDSLKNNKIEKILVLRSSPLPQFFDSMELLKKVFNGAKIEIVAQENVAELIKKKYTKSEIFIYKYKNFDKTKAKNREFKDIVKKKYDLLIYTVNSLSNNNGFQNVEDFALKFNSKFYLALNKKGFFFNTDKNRQFYE